MLGVISVVHIKCPQVTYHTIVPSQEELYCLNSHCDSSLSSILKRTKLLFGAIYVNVKKSGSERERNDYLGRENKQLLSITMEIVILPLSF